MEYLLQRVTRAEMISMLYIFLGYNQVLIKEDNQLKTAFTTLWETYKYLRMHFLSRWISVATHLFQVAQKSFMVILVIYYF
jgi:hypothetical protein